MISPFLQVSPRGAREAREIGEPVPGFYRMRLRRGGVFVPVLVCLPCPVDPETCEPMERSRQILALVDGREWCAAIEVWPFLRPAYRDGATGLEESLGPRAEAEYRFLADLAEHCRRHEPDAPEANPERKPKLNEMAPIF